jgi:hypothetical protein
MESSAIACHRCQREMTATTQPPRARLAAAPFHTATTTPLRQQKYRCLNSGCGAERWITAGHVSQAWRRRHADGSHGYVETSMTGTFLWSDLRPSTDAGDRRVFQMYEAVSQDAARTAADVAAKRRGHACTIQCTRWQEENQES